MSQGESRPWEYGEEELKDFCLRVMKAGESTKVDFKEALKAGSKDERRELAKDISSIANTDSRDFHNYGLILFGVDDQGNIKGCSSSFQESDLSQKLEAFVTPVPQFRLRTFDSDGQSWGVVLIPPSDVQPHLMLKAKDGEHDQHDIYVRVNTTTTKAGPQDHARFLSGAARRAIAPIQDELRALQLKVDRVERKPVLDGLQVLEALGKSRDPEELPQPAAVGSLAEAVRGSLSTPYSRLEDRVLEEARALRTVMQEDTKENPLVFRTDSQAELADQVIKYHESRTRPLAEALMGIVRLDVGEKMTPALTNVVRVLARTPSFSGGHNEAVGRFRIYPLVLLVQCLAMACCSSGRGKLLRRLLDVKFREEREEVPLVWVFRRLSNEIFDLARGQRSYVASSLRMRNVLPGWVSTLLPIEDPRTLFGKSEFLLSLEFTRVQTFFGGQGNALPGDFMYSWETADGIRPMLRAKDPILTELFGDDVESRLQDFDTSAPRIVQHGFPHGVYGDTLKSYRNEG